MEIFFALACPHLRFAIYSIQRLQGRNF